MDGDEQAIKAYAIAVDVFGRTGNFDPQADPIVRVQARRLRSLLEQYYATTGDAEAVRISLPVGRYVPTFRRVQAEADDVPSVVVQPSTDQRARPHGGITISWLSLLAITVGVAVGAFALSNWRPGEAPLAQAGISTGPRITIVEFQDLTGASGRKPVVAGLALELVTDLNAFEDIDARYSSGGLPGDTANNRSDFMLTGIVRRAEDAVQYSAILMDTGSGSVVWSRTIAVDEADAILASELDDLSRTFSLVLGSPRGPLHAPARRMLAGTTSLEGRETEYLCHVMFDLYRETQTLDGGTRAAACFAALPETQRQAALTLAESASLLADGMDGPGGPPLVAVDDRLRVAGANLERAAALAPLSGMVWEQRARWFELQGQTDAAGAAYASSIQLNPANADALAAYARLLALRGNLAQAEPLSDQALVSPMPPSWYYGVPTLVALRDGDLTKATSNAQTYSIADPELGSVLAVTAAWRAKSARVVSRYLPQVLEIATFRASGLLPRLRQRIGDEALLSQIGQALSEAGAPRAALDGPF
ncbi:hypothetical protein [uncultured Devosia sp.]|uniref:hypothetical protein n=1 Tax=uncultured Devosia sp. TaxID=211434 RepID=UPI0035CB0A08